MNENPNLFEAGMYFGIIIQNLRDCEFLLENIPQDDMHENALYSLHKINYLLDILDESEKV
jgi:hypothetical protein